jgi:hypothetical protein
MKMVCRHCDGEISPFDVEKTVLGSDEPSVILPGWIHMDHHAGMFDHMAEPPPEGVMRIEDERPTATIFEMGPPVYVGNFPIREDVEITPKGCMRVFDERPV